MIYDPQKNVVSQIILLVCTTCLNTLLVCEDIPVISKFCVMLLIPHLANSVFVWMSLLFKPETKNQFKR